MKSESVPVHGGTEVLRVGLVWMIGGVLIWLVIGPLAVFIYLCPRDQ